MLIAGWIIVLNIRLQLDEMSYTVDLAAVMPEVSSGLPSPCVMTDISKPIDKYPSQKGTR